MICDPIVCVWCDSCGEEHDIEMPLVYSGPMHTKPTGSLERIANDSALKGWALDFDEGTAQCPACQNDGQ